MVFLLEILRFEFTLLFSDQQQPIEVSFSSPFNERIKSIDGVEVELLEAKLDIMNYPGLGYEIAEVSSDWDALAADLALIREDSSQASFEVTMKQLELILGNVKKLKEKYDIILTDLLGL